MPTEFYFTIQYFNFDWKLPLHFSTVTETLNSEKSDSNQCYSESESATADSTFNIHSLNVLQFNHKTYQ